MKLLKNLWNHRRANAWLFFELIIVAILSWLILDPAIVSLYDIKQDYGYDVDRLLLLKVESIPEQSPLFDGAADSVAATHAAADGLLAKLRAHPAVERATSTRDRALPGELSTSNNRFLSGNQAKDTLVSGVVYFWYYGGLDYFGTLGFKTAAGMPSVDEISSEHPATVNESTCVISRPVADFFWPGENPVGKRAIKYITPDNDTIWTRVTGVVEGFRHQPQMRSRWGVYEEIPAQFYYVHEKVKEMTLVARLKPGVDPEDLVDEVSAWCRKEMRMGNLYVRSVTPYRQMLHKADVAQGTADQRMLLFILASFFLLNIVLGTIGTFWLQTRKRIPEMGIRRAFGSRKGGIVGMLVGENLILATVASVIGFLLYLQYALRNGLDNGMNNEGYMGTDSTWIGNFPEHFLIISAIILALILICVIVGTLLPALNVSRVQIVDALRAKE